MCGTRADPVARALERQAHDAGHLAREAVVGLADGGHGLRDRGGDLGLVEGHLAPVALLDARELHARAPLSGPRAVSARPLPRISPRPSPRLSPRLSRIGLSSSRNCAHVLELAVDAREAHVGHLVEQAQLLHHQRADHRARHLAVVLLVAARLDARRGALELLERDRQLLAGAQHARQHALAVEAHALAALLDHPQRRVLDALVGRVAQEAQRGTPGAAGWRCRRRPPASRPRGRCPPCSAGTS